MSGTFILVAPLLCVAIGGLAMMLVDAFTKDRAELSIVTTTILVAAGGLSLGLWSYGMPELDPAGMIGRYLAYDRLAFFMDLVLCGGGALAALLAGGYLREHGLERGEFYVILLFAVFGAMVLARAVNLLSFFLGLETLALGVYGLVAFRRHSPRSAEAGAKYFLLGSFASAFLLFGMALAYGASGHTTFSGIGDAVEAGTVDETLIILSMLLFVIGLAFKVGAVPFHMWAPDAYEGAITPVTTFMAVVVKAAVFAGLVRVFLIAFGHESLATDGSSWPTALAALSAITMIVGTLAAIVQKNVKRMLAYSSISHAGFILFGVVTIWKGNGVDGLSAVLFYLLAYTVSSVLAFGSLIWVGSRGKEAVSFDDLAGVGRRHPAVGLFFSLGVLSLMGFPAPLPTAGFFAKYYIVVAALEAGGALMIGLSILGVLTGAVGAYYYLRVLVYLFMKTPEPDAPIAVPMRSGPVKAALIISGYFVLRMGIAPDTYLNMAVEAATAFFA